MQLHFGICNPASGVEHCSCIKPIEGGQLHEPLGTWIPGEGGYLVNKDYIYPNYEHWQEACIRIYCEIVLNKKTVP
jgi:hypothetical protein